MKLKMIQIAMIVGMIIALTAPVHAQDPFTKLGRGVANTLTGWLEIPKGVHTTANETNAFVGMTGGLAKGLGAGLVRTAAGLYETFTFPLPVPQNYASVIEPEYVF